MYKSIDDIIEEYIVLWVLWVEIVNKSVALVRSANRAGFDLWGVSQPTHVSHDLVSWVFRKSWKKWNPTKNADSLEQVEEKGQTPPLWAPWCVLVFMSQCALDLRRSLSYICSLCQVGEFFT